MRLRGERRDSREQGEQGATIGGRAESGELCGDDIMRAGHWHWEGLRSGYTVYIGSRGRGSHNGNTERERERWSHSRELPPQAMGW